MSGVHATDLSDVLATVASCAEACRQAPLLESLKIFADAGVLGAIAEESHGGLGMDFPAGAAIVGTAGKALFSDSVGDALLAVRYVGRLFPGLADDLASGSAVCVVSVGGNVAISEDGRTLSGFVEPLPFADIATHLLLVTGDRPQLALVDLSADGVTRHTVDALDLERSYGAIWLDTVAPTAVGSDHAAECRSLCITLRAAWLEANARQALQIAVQHLAVREQFGRKLIGMPVVRQTLAHLGLKLENARLLNDDALVRLTGPAAETAYATNARVAVEVVEKSMHYLGAMGFTWEMPLHRYLRRVRSLVDATNSSAETDIVHLLADFASSRSSNGDASIA
ncbi:MAG: hypothetical protein KF694_24215 [Mesorhizobium sp.]|nr:hypothetical protein [Mesorhizobium sp.]